LIRWRPGVDPQEVLARYRDRFPRLGEGEEITSGNFADVVNFGGVQGAPLIVGGVLAALGAAALAHVLVTAIRQRRRDVAILKTMGFVRGQARRAVAWQSTFTVLVAMAIGVPLGIGGGRFLWGRVADNIGVRSRPHVSLILIGILVPAVIVIANLIAALPARSAARTRPALVLRSE
jgi:ABC-type lipoprotein release transport system permease subunit